MRGLCWLVAFALAASAAQAETFPSKPIRMIVPFPAGSATDLPPRPQRHPKAADSSPWPGWPIRA